MKKTLFLSVILSATLCSSAFGETKEYTGNLNESINISGYGAEDKIIFNMSSGTEKNWFNGTQSTAAAILIGNDAEHPEYGLVVTNGNSDNVITFSGSVTGAGAITKLGKGRDLQIEFTGNATEYTGAITLDSTTGFTLRFGGTVNDAAVTASATTAEKGISGTGTVTFKTNASSTLEYKYAASENPVYITNAITKESNGTAKVALRGGASYILTKDSTIDTITFSDNSSLKYTGSTQLSIGGQVASGSTLEGVITNNVSNVKYTGTYGANSGTLKNVQVHEFDAGATDGSITLNGVYGNIKNGGTQRDVTLTGNGLILTEGYTNGSYTFQTIDGAGKLEKRFAVNETFTFQNAAEWTGHFINTAGTANVTFNGNSKAQIDGKDTTNVTLKGTDYSQMQITAYNGKNTTVTVSNSADTTLKQFIQDPWEQTAGHGALVLNNGHKTTISQWATVDSVTLENNSSLHLNNHNIGTITVESGKSTVTSGAAIGSGHHLVGSIILKDNTDLTVTGDNNATITTLELGSGSKVTLGSEESHNHTLALQNLTVNGDATVNANLSLNTGATVTMHGAITMGCDVTISAGTVLTVDGNPTTAPVVLFEGVDNLTLGSTPIANATWTDASGILASVNGVTLDAGHQYVIGFWNGTVSVAEASVPEPATATLSLLALAALAARRKRK